MIINGKVSRATVFIILADAMLIFLYLTVSEAISNLLMTISKTKNKQMWSQCLS